jgi:putative aminopeptidase
MSDQPFGPAWFDDQIARLAALPGLSGHEGPVARALAAEFARLGLPARIDPIGNVIAQAGPDSGGPRLAVLAHMDTVGLLVKRHHADGTLGVVGVGGVNVRALPGAAVRVGALPGVIGVRSQHLARAGEPVPDVESLYVQVEPESAASIPVATPVTYAPQHVRLGDHLLSASYLDNRAGCAVLLALAESLAAQPPAYPVTLIGTVQEETTCAGALSALNAAAPALAIFVDGTLSYDTPDTRAFGEVALGAGPVLTAFLYASGLNGWHAHPGLRAHLAAVAAETGIPVQHDAVRGLMSDARVAGWLGLPSALIGLPMRGKHAPLETVHLDDLVCAARLLIATVRRALPDLSWT